MSEKLPYFKFKCDEWLTGDITLEEYSTQGIFINICAYYWKKDCSIAIAKLKQRYSNVTEEQWKIMFDSKVLKTKENGNVSILFLDDQWKERQKDHKIKSDAGKEGARVRWGSHNKANILPMAKHGNLDKDKDKDKDKDEDKDKRKDIKNKYSYLSKFLKHKILDQSPHSKITDTQLNNWSNEFRLMVERDNRSEKEIKYIIYKAFEDDFWKKVLRSASKLRSHMNNGKMDRLYPENRTEDNERKIIYDPDGNELPVL